MTIPKNKRIERKLFGVLEESKRSTNSKNFFLKTAPSNESKVAVIVSKKVSKKAVVRNKVRRRVYSIIKTLLPTLNNKLFLLIAKPTAKDAKGDALKEELSELFKKV